MPGGHLSHQLGLDVDVGLDVTPKRALTAVERETVELPSLVRADRRGVDPARWTADQVTLLHLAANLPEVDRILINPAIKRQLCEEVRGDRAWLRLMRPWYGHAAHMHIRFRCPAGQRELRPGRATAARRRLRCDAAMVVRSVGCATEAVAAVSPAAIAGRLQGGDGGTVRRWVSPRWGWIFYSIHRLYEETKRHFVPFLALSPTGC